jgi:hypothetical protein
MKILAVVFVLFSIEDMRYALFGLKKRIDNYSFKLVLKVLFTTKSIRIMICILIDILLIVFSINYLISN